MSTITRNYEDAMQELISTIPAGEEGQSMINEYGLTKAAFIAFLMKYGIDLTEQHLSKRIQSSILMDGQIFTGLRNLELFTGDFNSEVSNMKNASYILPEGEHKVIFGLLVETGSTAGGNTPPNSYTFGPVGVGGNAIYNGTVSLKNNGTIVASELPLSQAISELSDRGIGYIPLDQPVIWKGQTDLVAQLKFKVATADEALIRLSYVGIGLIS